MSFLGHTVQEFLDQVDSKSPAPGGGSVSAISALLGVGLARMVGHITIGRKAFKALDSNQQETFLSAFEELGLIQKQLSPLVDKDTEAFNAIMAAYTLPKDTEVQQAQRNEAIQQATIQAIDVPLLVASLSHQALQVMGPIEAYGNKNALSDVGVAVLELNTAVRGALMNVQINIAGLQDKDLQQMYQQQVIEIKRSSYDLVGSLLTSVDQRL